MASKISCHVCRDVHSRIMNPLQLVSSYENETVKICLHALLLRCLHMNIIDRALLTH